MNIFLSTDLLVVTKILKKTSAIFFKNLIVGDVIRIFGALKRQERGRELYAFHLKVVNTRTGETHVESITNLCNRLSNFEFEVFEVEDEN